MGEEMMGILIVGHMLHSTTIRLIYVYQLETLYQCHGVKCQPGVIWGHRGRKVIFTKCVGWMCRLVRWMKCVVVLISSVDKVPKYESFSIGRIDRSVKSVLRPSVITSQGGIVHYYVFIAMGKRDGEVKGEGNVMGILIVGC